MQVFLFFSCNVLLNAQLVGNLWARTVGFALFFPRWKSCKDYLVFFLFFSRHSCPMTISFCLKCLNLFHLLSYPRLSPLFFHSPPQPPHLKSVPFPAFFFSSSDGHQPEMLTLVLSSQMLPDLSFFSILCSYFLIYYCILLRLNNWQEEIYQWFEFSRQTPLSWLMVITCWLFLGQCCRALNPPMLLTCNSSGLTFQQNLKH